MRSELTKLKHDLNYFLSKGGLAKAAGWCLFVGFALIIGLFAMIEILTGKVLCWNLECKIARFIHGRVVEIYLQYKL